MTTDRNFYRNPSRVYPVVERTQGIYVYDEQGREFIDFGSGIGVTSIGAGVEQVIDKMTAQLQQTTFVFNGKFTSRPRIELSQKLLQLCPPGISRVIFSSSGSEANEVAIKIARQYHRESGQEKKYKVISRRQSYHGNTCGSLSVSDRPSWQQHFEPYLHDFPKISPPYCYRCPLQLEYPTCEMGCARELEDVILAEGPESVSAFIAEPILGTTVAGVTAPDEYYPLIRSICDKYNVLFIADEVITGLGRTGANFGLDHWGVAPDLITVAKGLAAGYAPLAATLVSETICTVITEGSQAHSQGFTYSGNPLSCAAGLAVLDYIRENDLVEQARVKGDYLAKRLETLSQIDIVGDLRGRGMFRGIEFVSDCQTREPFPASVGLTQRIVDRAYEKGLILIGGMPGCADGVSGDQLQLSPALVMTEPEIDQAVERLRQSIEDVRNELIQQGIHSPGNQRKPA